MCCFQMFCRSARDAEELIQKALRKGEKLPETERFDSNCITPGTRFMAELHRHLQYFVTRKISTDAGWQQCTVILSGHQVRPCLPPGRPLFTLSHPVA